MQVETLFGNVSTRELATSMQRSHSLLLKDNPDLKPLFEWLKNLHIKSLADVKSERLSKTLNQIKFNREVKFHVDEDVPMIVFHNILPLQGDFHNSIAEYINTLYKAMYNPEEAYL